MGNSSSLQTVSQNSTGKSRPCVLRVVNNESRALHGVNTGQRGAREGLLTIV